MAGLSEVRQVWKAVEAAEARGQHAVLAEIVAVAGSAYRRPGALMMMAEDGRMEGTISGGCLEGDLFVRAQPLFAGGAGLLVDYDLAEDDMWSLGIGCKGHIQVWLTPVPQGSRRARWAQALAGGGVMAVQLPSGDETWWLPGEPPLSDAALMTRVEQAWAGAPPACDESGWYVRAWRPAERLVLVGAGHDAEPVASLAHRLGFQVTVVDPRETFNDSRRFPDAKHLVVDAASITPANHPELLGAYWVVMNHHKQRDQAALVTALAMAPKFVGALGPWARTAELLVGVADAERVHGPLGLDIGAETPEAVAVSIVAELMAVAHGRTGGPLNRRERVHAWP